MTTGAPASEPTKVKYSAAEAPVRARTGYASDWRTWLAGALILLAIGYVWYSRRQAAETSAAAKSGAPGLDSGLGSEGANRRSEYLFECDWCGDSI